METDIATGISHHSRLVYHRGDTNSGGCACCASPAVCVPGRCSGCYTARAAISGKPASMRDR